MNRLQEVNEKIAQLQAEVQSDNCPNVAFIQIGYARFVLPVVDAIAVYTMLGMAQKYETRYVSGEGEKHHIGGELPTMTITLLDKTAYIEGLINGERPKT